MKKFNVFLLCFFSFLVTISKAQERYLDSIFEEITIDSNIVYGVNANILTVFQGQAIPQSLMLDLYQPQGDTIENRPIVLLFHSGMLLPFPQNLMPVGTRKDSAMVDIATKLTQRGYVVASCDYRLGWEPTAPVQDLRKFSLVNAIYRGIQDARTAIRFFKRDVIENNNTYRIDPNKIVLWGNGAGGFISLGCATLDNFTKIDSSDQLTIIIGNDTLPVISEEINGDIWGTSVGIAQMYPPFPDGDTLCYPNWVGYDSDFRMAVNMSGAIVDTSWIDENTNPTVSFHVPTDQIIPCNFILMVLPWPYMPILEISGSCDYQRKMKEFGNHQEWENQIWLDPMTDVADSRNEGLEGFFPFLTDSIENNAPWDWWAEDLSGQFGPPDVETAKLTIDSAIAYFTPRACLTLDLGCDLSGIVPIDEVEMAIIDLQVSPNPAKNYIQFHSTEYPIEHIFFYELSGKQVKSFLKVNAFEFLINTKGIENGFYIAKVKFKDGFVSKKIVVQK